MGGMVGESNSSLCSTELQTLIPTNLTFNSTPNFPIHIYIVFECYVAATYGC